jgi:REP element-mobilizing transposase RayT
MLFMGSPTSARNRDREGAVASTYLITFVCYGAWLPGQPGAVDRHHNLFGSPLQKPNEETETRARSCMQQLPYRLDTDRRRVVLGSMQQVCSIGTGRWLAAHVRTKHVHVVVAADQSPEQVMNALKAYASRALNKAAFDRPDRRRWAHHGSTRHLWTTEAVSAAVHYIGCEQGEPMAVFQMPSAR